MSDEMRLDLPSVGQRLGNLSERGVRRLIALGELAAVAIGRRRFVDKRALELFIRRKTRRRPATA
jgi:hypothetical protein